MKPKFGDDSDVDAAMAGISFPKGADGRWPCPWPGCTQSLSALSSVRRHYKSNHMEQQPQACKVCHNMFKNQAACENHMKSVHNITNKELKMAQFMPMSEDGKHGLYALENGKSLCSMCSTALSTVGSGKRHYKNVHLGEKLPSQMGGSGGPDDSGGEGYAAGVSQPTHSMGQAVSSYPPTPSYPTASGYPAATSAYPQPASNPGMVPSMSVDGTGLATDVNMAAFEAHLMKLEH